MYIALKVISPKFPIGVETQYSPGFKLSFIQNYTFNDDEKIIYHSFKSFSYNRFSNLKQYRMKN